MKNLLIHFPLILFLLIWCPLLVVGLLYLVELHVNIWVFLGCFTGCGVITVVLAAKTFPCETNYLNKGRV